jgi:hypothetical protein
MAEIIFKINLVVLNASPDHSLTTMSFPYIHPCLPSELRTGIHVISAMQWPLEGYIR